MPIGAIIGGIGALAGGALQAGAVTDSANLSANAANNALRLQEQQYADTRSNLSPYLGYGNNAAFSLANYFGVAPGEDASGASFLRSIGSQIGPPPSPTDPRLQNLGGVQVTPPPDPSDPNLRNKFLASPGYQYILDQSNKAITNQASGRTGAISGNMMEALQKNSAGLAAQDWNNFYNQDVNSWANGMQNWWNNYNALVQSYGQTYSDEAARRNQIIAALSGFAGGGQSAAVNQGNFGAGAATSAGNAIQNAAGAIGAWRIGATNAFTNAFNSPNVTNGLNATYNYLFPPTQPAADPSQINLSTLTGYSPDMTSAALGYGTSY